MYELLRCSQETGEKLRKCDWAARTRDKKTREEALETKRISMRMKAIVKYLVEIFNKMYLKTNEQSMSCLVQSNAIERIGTENIATANQLPEAAHENEPRPAVPSCHGSMT